MPALRLTTTMAIRQAVRAGAGPAVLSLLAVLNLIEWEQRRKTLVAERLDRRGDGGAAVYRFDIRLQGEDETVFFDV